VTHQDNRSLQDRLAQRLYEIDPQGKGSSDIRPWSSVGYVTQQRYSVLAAECLRQMEWQHAKKREEGTKYRGSVAWNDNVDLAPPEWRPHE
jgi:hypothetical protein